MKKLLLLLVLSTTPALAQNPGFLPSGPTTACPVPTALSVTGTSSRTQLNNTVTCGQTVILYNIGSQEAFYRLGTDNTVVATTGDNSLPGNTFVVLGVLNNQTYVAAITATSTTTIRLVQGNSR